MAEPEEFNMYSDAHLEEYDGVYRSVGTRTFVNDVDTNIAVRSEYNRVDFEYYRSAFKTQHSRIEVCDKAYDHIGIIYSMINLMADFTIQGIRIVHEDPKLQKFYRALWKRWDAHSVSERFCNYAYRIANVPVYIHTGRINKKAEKEFSTFGEDITVTKRPKRNIPVRFTFLHPKQLKVLNGSMSTITGKYKYGLRLSNGLVNVVTNRDNTDSLQHMPIDFLQQLKKKPNMDHYPLSDEQLEVYFYKKDDWKIWATPMIYPMIEDLQLYQSMKLADASALDGAISNIRLWNMGDLQHKVYPTPTAINKLSNILKKTTPGTMDLVWGPDLKVTETNTNVYQYLKSEKYEQVVKDIYIGLGIPPSLSGSGGSGSANSANTSQISIKTLIERLEYVRRELVSFWDKQLEKVQKAMGHKKRARIVFDYKVLSDDSAEKKLLLDMYDRDLISWEGIAEKYGVDSELEKARTKKESTLRAKGKMPPKASPYHNPQTDYDYKKILLQQGIISPAQIGIELDEKEEGDKTKIEIDQEFQKENLLKQKNNPVNPEGRPKNSKDVRKRKSKDFKVDTTKAGFANTFLWATETQKLVHDYTFPAYLQVTGKKNARQLTKEEAEAFEKIKFKVLSQIQPFSSVNTNLVSNLLEAGKYDNDTFVIYYALLANFKDKNDRMPTVDEQRQLQVAAYAFNNEDENE